MPLKSMSLIAAVILFGAWGVGHADVPKPDDIMACNDEAQEAARDGVEEVLLGAADAGRGLVRLAQLPLQGEGVEDPRQAAELHRIGWPIRR